MSDQLLLRHSQVFNQRMTFLRASRLSFAPFFGMADQVDSHLAIVLEEELVTAGQFVNGSIFIKLNSKLTNCELVVSSTGLEELKVYNNFRLSSEKSNKVYSISLVVRDWKEMLTGNYKVPFTLRVPQNSPASFYYSDEDVEKNYIKSSISYLISASLVCKETELSHHLHFAVKSSISLTPALDEIQKLISCNQCICFSSGASMCVIVPQEKGHCVVNGKFIYKLLVNNSNSSKAVVKICSQIVRAIKFVTNRQEFKSKNILSKIQRSVLIPHGVNQTDTPDLTFIHDLLMGREDFNTSTVNSKLITCQFFLEIFVFYEGKANGAPSVMLHELVVNPEAVKADPYSQPSIYNEEPQFNLLIDN